MAKIHPEYVAIGCPAAEDAAASSPSGHCFSWSICGWTYFYLISSLVFAFLFYIGILLATVPAPPQVSIASASVASFSISSFPPQFSADFNVTLSLHNPSGNFHYKDVSAAMMYGPTVLANAPLPDFHQSKRNSTTLRVALAAAAEPNVAFGRMRRDRETDGAVVFRFDMWARVTYSYRPRVLNFPTMMWWVSCDEITIWFPDGTGTVGSTVGPPTSCELHQWEATT